jgi:hypothetical protein
VNQLGWLEILRHTVDGSLIKKTVKCPQGVTILTPSLSYFPQVLNSGITFKKRIEYFNAISPYTNEEMGVNQSCVF